MTGDGKRTEDLFLDWLASALAGKGSRPVRVLEQFSGQMGPAAGPSERGFSRRTGRGGGRGRSHG